MTAPTLTRHTDPAAWDRIVGGASDANVFQSVGWGEYSRAARWAPVRFVGEEDGEVTFAVQLLLRRLPLGITVGWAPGGPVIGFGPRAARDLGKWMRALARQVSASGTAYLRVDCQHPVHAELLSQLPGAFRRPIVAINTGVTTVLDLTRDPEDLVGAMRKEHRRELRLARAAGLRWVSGRDRDLVQALLSLHGEMLLLKDLRTRRHPAEGDVIRLLDVMKSARVTVGYQNEVPVTAALVLGAARRAFFFMSATGSAGRSASASYELVLRVAEESRAQGLMELDLGGLISAQRSAGTDLFKRGFGGEVRTRLGEWEWSTTSAIRLAANAAIALRGPEVRGS